MQLKDINKDSYTIIRQKCIYLNDNKAMYYPQNLINLADITNNENFRSLFVNANDIKPNMDYSDYIDLYGNYDGIFSYIYQLRADQELIDDEYFTTEYTALAKTISYTIFKNTIELKLENNLFIGRHEIEMCKQQGESEQYINQLITARQIFYDKSKLKDIAERKQRDEEEQAKQKIAADKLNAILNQAETDFLNHKRANNEFIEVTSYYDQECTLYLLFKRNDIQIPIKTIGWIRTTLYSILMNEEFNTPQWQIYKSTKYKKFNDSTVISTYIRQLYNVLKEKYNTEQEEQSENIASEEDINHLFGIAQ
ncbi:MAG TPA: hypothetical protein VIK86_07875 [Candidatus Paceibacterota bacterium]